MSKRPTAGRGLFYHRDSEGHSELAPPQYVAWAQARAKELGVSFSGTPEAMEAMVTRNASNEHDLFLDYGLAGNLLSRPGLDALRWRALTDRSVSHLFVIRRDRLARPDNPLDAMSVEYDLRSAGLTLVLKDKVLPPIPKGARIDPADLITGLLDYDSSGKFRRDLAVKLVLAKVALAKKGFSIGGEPMYGFRRWHCRTDGRPVRELAEHEVVKMPDHHVAWLPTAEDELKVVRRILDAIETTPANRIADALNADGIPSPKAGGVRKVNGFPVPNSGLWTQTTVRNIAANRLLAAVCEYGKRAEGDEQRMTAAGPRDLSDGDYGADGKPKTVRQPDGPLMTAPARFEPVVPPDRHARIAAVLEERGRHLKGKPRARGDSPNPLGGRVFDLNCGWPMYRLARRGRWAYRCGLYQNSDSACCRHNVVPGPQAARFVLACVRQRVLAPATLAKLRARLEQLAASEKQADPASRQRAADEVSLVAVRRKLEVVGRNMALAQTPDQRTATAAVFDELKEDERRLEERLRQPAGVRAGGPEEQVDRAMAALDRLVELTDTTADEYQQVGELFQTVGAKLYLRFGEETRGRQPRNVTVGGVLTFGSAPPPGPLYEGPVDKAVLRQKLAAGEAVSPVLGCGTPGSSDAGPEVGRSANVQRGTRRGT